MSTADPPSTRKHGLWSYILPPTPTLDAPTQPLPAPLPTTGPSDRNALSVRLMLGDAKAALQQLSDRVERVVSEAADARREVADVARGAEDARAGLVKEVQAVVKQAMTSVHEANIAHTSVLQKTTAHISSLEATLAAQARAISDLAQTCAVNHSATSELAERSVNAYSTLLSLLPLVPLVHSIPTEIENGRLRTTHAIECLGAETVRFARDSRVELEKLAEVHAGAVQRAVTEQSAAWKTELEAVAGQLREEMGACTRVWTGALEMHRQEISGLLSARMACLRTPADGGMSPKHLPRPREQDPVGSSSQVERMLALDAATSRACSEVEPGSDVPYGSPCSISRAGERGAPQSHVPVKTVEHQGDAGPEFESQSTALSLPDNENITLDAQDLHAGPFGLLNRTRSANPDFTVPDSPPFSAHRQPLNVAKVPAAPLEPSVSNWATHRAPSPVIHTSPWSIAPTLGRSSPSPSARSPQATLRKRARASQGHGPGLGPAKRQKTRILWDMEQTDAFDD